MSLDDLYMQRPLGRARGLRVTQLDPWPVPTQRTAAQGAALRKARRAQVGKTKAPNMVKR